MPSPRWASRLNPAIPVQPPAVDGVGAILREVPGLHGAFTDEGCDLRARNQTRCGVRLLDVRTKPHPRGKNAKDAGLLRWPAVRAGGLVVVAFGISVAADRAMLGAATDAQRTQVAFATLATVSGVAMVAAAQLRIRHSQRGPAAVGRHGPIRALALASLLMAVMRGLPQLGDLADQLRADRDEPTTALVHVARLALTAVLAAGLAVAAYRERAALAGPE